MDNILDKLYFLNVKKAVIQTPKIENFLEKKHSIKLENRSISITEEGSILTGQIVTVHNLGDYRRKNSSLLLIPKTEALVDNLLFNKDTISKEAVRLK